MRKRLPVFFVFIFSIALISALDLPGELAGGSSGIVEILVNALGPLFAAILGGPKKVLFEKILLFFVITSIVYMVIMKRIELFNDNKAIVAIVTFSVSILSTRFLLWTDLVYSIILPYSVLGVALSAFFPLLVAFFFIEQFNNGFLRKIFWIFFIVIFAAMWTLRYADVGAISWIYFWTAAISLIFLLFDGTIRRAMIRQKMVAAGVHSNLDFAREVRRKLHEAHEDFSDEIINQHEYNELKRKYNKQLRDLAKF